MTETIDTTTFTPRGRAYRVPVHCTATFADGSRCNGERFVHVHGPTPCANGQDDRHHEFAPPKSVQVQVDGHVRRVKVPA